MTGNERKSSSTFTTLIVIYDDSNHSVTIFSLGVLVQVSIFVDIGLATWLIFMPGIHIVDTWMELVLQVLVCTYVTSLIGIMSI